MKLSEAIEEVKGHSPNGKWVPWNITTVDHKAHTAIATILNAVVKGELKYE